MSKGRILPLMFLLAALTLAACGRRAEETPPPEEAPPAEDTAPAAEVPELPPDLPEGAVPLTAEEIARVNEAFQPTLEREDGLYVNPLTCWVSSYYRWPEELDLSALLRHFSPGAELSGEAEFEALKAAEDWPFGDISRDRMPVPIHKYLRSDVDAGLQKHMGITTEHLYSVPYSGPGAEEYSRSSPFLYLPEYEAYYNFVSDVDPGYFQCTSGWYSESMARLTGDTQVLTLGNWNGTWLFRSFLPLKTE